MKKVAIYVRVSTLEQAESGYSIDEQISKLTKYAEVKDWTVYQVYKDPGFSGSNIKRPAITRLINDIPTGNFDTVLVYKLDRLSRSQKDTLHLIEDLFIPNNIDFISLNENFDTSTAFGKAMIGILSVFAQLEREQIKERMQLGKAGRAKSGKAMSWHNPPFGYTYNPKTENLEINPIQANIVKQMFSSYLSGTSITKLRTIFNESGHIGKDINWSFKTIRGVLDNPVYYGTQRYKGQLFKGNQQPIISKATFDETQKQILIRQHENAEKYNPRPFQSKYMLSGKLKCGYCGAPLKIQIGHRTNGEKIRRYECTNRSRGRAQSGPTIYNNGAVCDSGFYYADDIEHKVLVAINKLKVNPDLVDKKSSHKMVAVDNSQLQKDELNRILSKIEKVNDLYINNLIDMDELKSRTNGFMAQKTALERSLSHKAQSLKDNREKELSLQRIKNFLAELDTDHLNDSDKKRAVDFLIKKVSVTDSSVKIAWNF